MTFRLLPISHPMQEQIPSGPLIDVKQISQSSGSDFNTWKVNWRIGNLGRHPLRLLSARLPHGRFRGKEIIITEIKEIGPRDSTHIELTVLCKELPGTEVENAFLILRVMWQEESWLILVRLRVIFDEQGIPFGKTEVITSQRVGFSSNKE